MKKAISILLAFILASPLNQVHAWSECGHHIIAVMAYDMLTPAQQRELMRILETHPRFQQDFTMPEGTANVDHWMIGRAGYWPDVARRQKPWDRPSWHFQLGATNVVGTVDNVPAFPVGLPDGATLETNELHIAQAIELCRKIAADPSEPNSNKAVAICWLCHLVADTHQPCNAGSLYVEKVFPEGDQGANSIEVKQGSNMHALWDGLLGRQCDEGDIRRRISEIRSEALFLSFTGFDARFDDLKTETWLEESRQAAKAYVYASEVMEPIFLAMRAETESKLQPIDLSEGYLQAAGRVAQLRAIQSSGRLAAILSQVRSSQSR